MKRITIIGKGTAGAFSVSHFHRWSNYEIEWRFDPNIQTQAVGEASNVILPRNLFRNMGFTYSDLEKIDGTLKVGILKSGWSDGKTFYHDFIPPNVGLHFNAKKFQEMIYDNYKHENKIKIVEGSCTHDEIDSDFILDCSGKPDSYDEYIFSKFIPVNSVFVTQCYWKNTQFFRTLTIARPYGWVFGVPLNNRCSIGYLFNKEISSLQDIKEDVKNIFKEFNLEPSEETNHFSFNNYYRKQNFSPRIVYNGNSSFFLEPIEATSIGFMNIIQNSAQDVFSKKRNFLDANKEYIDLIREFEDIIMLHYFSGSKYKTTFWNFAEEKALRCLELAVKKPKFLKYYENSKKFINKLEYIDIEENWFDNYGSWWLGSFTQNLENLQLYNKIDKLIKG